MTLQYRRDAIVLMALAAADAIAPPDPMPPSAWAKANLIVPDGGGAGSLWNPELTPYILEPLDFLGPDSPVNEIAVKKSAQTGFTMLLIAAIGHTIDRDPCRVMLIQPTDAALNAFNRGKLQPSIDGSKALRAKVAPQKARDGLGSTTYSKLFPGGELTMAIASSGAALRSQTIKKLFRDEIDEYPDNLDGQGDPLRISDGRLISFLTSGDWKKADVSTPTIKGGSKIEQRYLAGDQRRWRVPCPQCDGEFSFEFGENFCFENKFPFNAFYVAPCCGAIVHSAEKNALARKGRWVATDPRPGAFPSYHFDALSSPFVPWDHFAKEFLESRGDPQREKAFANLWLGEAYEIKGDAPDHVRLMERREDGLLRGHIPPRGLMLVASADVQMRGLWVKVEAFAPNRESWVVEAFYIDGSTEAPSSADGAPNAFDLLQKQVLDRDWPDAFGRTRKLDALGVDSGYRAHVVYSWVRKVQRLNPNTGQDVVFALKGADGWGRPAIGTPSLVDIDLAGHRVKKGAKVWTVGAWSLKAAFYEDVRKEGLKSGRERDPDGYCHFPDWLDENFFRQITAEFVADETFKGRTRKFWKMKSSERDNHFLDCSAYNRALADHLGLSSLTDDEWKALAKERGMPDSDALALFAPAPSPQPSPVNTGEGAASPPPEESPRSRLERLLSQNAGRFR